MEPRNVFRDAFDKAISSMRFSLPGVIVSYNDETVTASVRIGLLSKFKDRDAEEYPVIDDVPVSLPVFGDCQIRPPADVFKGMTCNVIFSERSLTQWLEGDGSPVFDSDRRRFALSDAVAYPGLVPAKARKRRIADADSFEISRGKTFIAIRKSGALAFQKEKDELLEALQKLVETLEGTRTNTGIGLQQFDPRTLAALKETKETIKRMRT